MKKQNEKRIFCNNNAFSRIDEEIIEAVHCILKMQNRVKNKYWCGK